MIRTWLIDSRGFAEKVKNNGVSFGHEIEDCGTNRQCPNCDYRIHNTDDLPGFPAGVKFDPSDVELLQHLAAKCGTGDLEPHVLIDKFIPTLDGGEGICYTHPENLPGAKKDGSSVHFFYKIVNAYASGKRKRRRIQDKESTIKARVRWHKTGKTKPVIKEHGVHIGYKKIMVLYTTPKPVKSCNWVMHQYHLGGNIDEREGEYVVSKIFYAEKNKTSLLISESNMGTVDQVIPTTNTPYTCREEKTSYSDCRPDDNYITHTLVQDVENLKEQFHPSCTNFGLEYQMDYASCLAREYGAFKSDYLNIDTSAATFGDFKSNYASLIQVESNASIGIGDLDNLELDTPPASSGNLVEYQKSARYIYITVATSFIGVMVCFLAFWWFKKRRSKANPSNDDGKKMLGRGNVPISPPSLPNDDGSGLLERGTGVTDPSPKVSNDVDNVESKHKLGKLVISEKIIGKGSDGTVVFEGNLDKRLVAVKRMNKSHIKLAEKQMAHLLESDNHPNIVRYYGIDEDRDFVYLILERCTCSLSDLVKVYVSKIQGPQVQRNEQLLEIFGTKGEFKLLENNGHPSALFLKLMRDVVFGISYLHNEKRIVHRDLKPRNILITKNGTLVFAKLTDMGISKALDEGKSSLPKNATGNGTSGWRAPELIDPKKRQTPAVDLFSLGCILFYCITGGKHPFGKYYIQRDGNIKADKKKIDIINNLPEAKDLIFQLLNPDPDLRPTAVEVLKHPLFWDAEKRVSFLSAVSDHINLGPRNAGCLTPELEKINKLLFGTEWKTKLDSDIIRDLNKLQMRYRYSSVSELLRLIRNLSHHCKDYSRSTKTVLGSGTPEGILKYFTTCFPTLLMGVYKTVLSHSANKQEFDKFFE